MKSLLLIGALTLSLTANVWLATSRQNSLVAPGSVPENSAPVKSDKPSTAASAAASVKAFSWDSPRQGDDLPALISHLRAAGLPAKSIHAILAALLTEQMRASFAKVPFWQRMSPNKETTVAQQAAARAMQTKLEQILGADGRQSITMDPVTREQRYGSLTDEKLEAVLKLERDYQEIRTNTTQQPSGYNPDEFKERQAQINLLENEKLADLANILTPAELEAYELRNSASARSVIAAVRDIAVSEDEYAAIFRLQKAADATNPMPLSSTFDQGQSNKWRAGQVALQEQIHAVLPDDRFYKFLEVADLYYGMIAGFARQNPSVTPATSYKVYQLQNEAEAALSNLSQQSRTAGENSPAAAELASKLAAYNTRLDALLGPDLAAAYRKKSFSRIFIAPKKPTPPGGG